VFRDEDRPRAAPRRALEIPERLNRVILRPRVSVGLWDEEVGEEGSSSTVWMESEMWEEERGGRVERRKRDRDREGGASLSSGTSSKLVRRERRGE
jgi:hypothetical protein